MSPLLMNLGMWLFHNFFASIMNISVFTTLFSKICFKIDFPVHYLFWYIKISSQDNESLPLGLTFNIEFSKRYFYGTGN